MSPLSFIRQVPPRFVGIGILVVGPIAIACRWLFSTLAGAFAFSVGLYFWFLFATESRPMRPEQLAIWLSELPLESRISIASAIITVVGFLVAFRTATANWRAQTVTGLRLEAAAEIQAFYDEVSRLLLDFKNYCEDMARTVGEARAGCSDVPSHRLAVLAQDLEEFRGKRTRFSRLSVEVYRLVGKHYPVCGALPGLVEAMRDCESCVDEVSQAMWVRAPVVDLRSPEEAGYDLLREVEPEEWQRFSDCCDVNYDRLGALTSIVRSTLFKDVQQITFHSILDVARYRSWMEGALGQVHRRRK